MVFKVRITVTGNSICSLKPRIILPTSGLRFSSVASSPGDKLNNAASISEQTDDTLNAVIAPIMRATTLPSEFIF
jgi:hypothetical protein